MLGSAGSLDSAELRVVYFPRTQRILLTMPRMLLQRKRGYNVQPHHSRPATIVSSNMQATKEACIDFAPERHFGPINIISRHAFRDCWFPSDRMITGISRFVRRDRNQDSVKCELHNTYKCCRTVNPTPAFARFRPTSPPCLLGEILHSGPSTSRPSGQFLTFAFMKLGYISWPAC